MIVPLAIFDEIDLYPNMWLSADEEGGLVTLNIHMTTRDSRNPDRELTIIHPTLVPDEILECNELGWLAFIRHCLIQLAIHEVDEWFRYRGELVHDPHKDPMYRQHTEDLVSFEPMQEGGVVRVPDGAEERSLPA